VPVTVAEAHEYGIAVLDAKIEVCQWTRLAVERHFRDLEEGHKRGLSFSVTADQHVLDFFRFLKHSKGEWAGTYFELAPWQAFWLSVQFGWLREDGLRRFRTAYWECPRKSGKSTLLAGGGLYLFFADGEQGAEVYSAATKRDQAKISHGEATRMVQRSPGLSARIGVYKDNLHHVPSASKFEPLGADADTLDGLNVHAALIDELHAHKSRNLWDVLETGAGSRRQPMQWAITTAGFDTHGICYEQRSYLLKILQRIFEDDTYFGVIYSLDEEDLKDNRWATERAWRKANPNYGISVKPDDMQRLAQKALELPAAQNNFLCKRLDVWTRQETLWMNMDKWAACAGEVDLEALRGKECIAGLDLSSTKDITALVLLFPTEAGLKVYGRYYLPEEAIAERARVDRVPYDIWHREGKFQVTPGNQIDYGFVRRDINELQKQFVIREIAYDRWGAVGLATDLQGDGFTVVPIGQGFASLSAPTKELERLVLGKGIAHGGDPVLTWMMSNVATLTDPAENIKPAKNKSTERIDGVVALIMALARQMVLPPTAGSVYEGRGIVTL